MTTSKAKAVSKDRAEDLFQKLSSLLDTLSREDAEALLDHTTEKMADVSEQIDEHQRSLHAQRAAVKAKVRPLNEELNRLANIRLQLASILPGVKIG